MSFRNQEFGLDVRDAVLIEVILREGLITDGALDLSGGDDVDRLELASDSDVGIRHRLNYQINAIN